MVLPYDILGTGRHVTWFLFPQLMGEGGGKEKKWERRQTRLVESLGPRGGGTATPKALVAMVASEQLPLLHPRFA